jgi:LysM repeat protein
MPARGAAFVALALAFAFAAGCASRGHLVMRKGARPVPSARLAKILPVPLSGSAGAASAAPVPQPLTVPAQAPSAMEVKVELGDSLWRISRRTLGEGVRWDEIAEVNRLKAPWILTVGTLLKVPAPGEETAARERRPRRDRAPSEAELYGWSRTPNEAYTVGEKLTFAVQWGDVTAGYATLSIPEVVDAGGRPAFHIVAEARTHPFFETFFKVRDRLDSFIDVDYGFAWRFQKTIHEGGFEAQASYDFDQRDCRILEAAKGTEAPMPIGSQDVLSCFYYYRTLAMEPGTKVVIPVTADDKKTYALTVEALRREKTQTLAGEFDCIVVRPLLTFEGVFQQKGEVLLWITDDRRRIPVKIRSKIAIGSININLQDAEWVEPAHGDEHD